MAVITISRQYGCGGMEVATRLCELLDFSFFDKGLMAEVAVDVGLSEREVVDLSEDNYNVKNFWERLFGRGPRTVVEHETGTRDASDEALLTAEKLNEYQCVNFVRSTIRAAYERDKVVILGRGGQAILQDKSDVIHVRVEAPLSARLQRVQDQEGLSLRDAEKLVNDRDRASAHYLKNYYDVDWSDSHLYHLVINTGKWDLEAAARIVVNAISQLPAEQPAG